MDRSGVRTGDDNLEVRAQVPRFDPSFVSRPRLIDRLLGTTARLVLLRAPAGFSKTTCIAEWAGVDPRPFAWISANRLHEDPASLIAVIVDALGEIESLDADVLDALASPQPGISDVVLPRLERSVPAISEPFVLVIDDAHLLASAGALEAIEVLVGALPAGSLLALTSRVEPRLHLGRLRASRELLELDERDLAMTRAESGALLEGMGLELDPKQLELLFERTEGWPAVLYLAGLSLTEQPDTSAAIASFAGDDRIVSDYLRDELLATLPRASLRFMTRTAVLDELSGPVCDAVAERSGSARVLRELARSNALVVPLDRKDDRYRYHHLLAEHLLSELRRREPEVERSLHERASRWYETQGDLGRAVEHAIAADEVERTGALIWDAFPELSGRGRIATVERWLDRIENRGTAFPAVALASAHRHVVQGHGELAAHWTRIAEASEAPAESRDEIAGHVHLLRAILAADGVERMGKDAAAAARMLSAEHPFQSPCFFFCGVSSHLSGDSGRADGLLREAARRGAVVSSVVQSLALSQLSLISIEGEDWGPASRLIAQAREQVGRCGLTGYPTMSMIFATSAVVRSHYGEVESAHADIQQSQRLLDELSSFPPWYDVQVRLILFRACTRLDDVARGSALVDEASRSFALTPDAELLGRWLAEATAAVGSSVAATRRAEFSLTKAELRTLQYLPSHLSFPEIARRAQVSPNTVKTQARAIYRKLDATSRAEAVERARAARLLDEAPGVLEPDRV